MTQTRIDSVQTGKVVPFRADEEPSAIAKHPLAGPVAVTPTGLAGDEQADLVHHGGLEKAVHHYPYDHYAAWRAEIGDHPLLGAPGGFGENLSSQGLLETQVCIGDTFRLGTALVQVSQGRQPCWKIGHRFGLPALTARVIEKRRPGWYYRVLEPGMLAAGDAMTLVDRVLPQWSVARVFGLLIAGDWKREPETLGELAATELLAEPWRRRASELSAG
jgi:MOSC domain-containing protein YiiM